MAKISRFLLGPLLCMAAQAVSAQNASARPEVTIDPGDVPPAVLQAVTASVDHIVSLSQDQDVGEVDRLQRRARDVTITALATEGYFTPVVTLEAGMDVAGPTWDITIEPGKRAIVQSVDLDFEGAITSRKFAKRVREVRESWGLKQGKPFRNEEWEAAKRDLIAAISETDFAMARVQTSEARVDAEAATVALTVKVASGPQVILGELEVEGLRRVPESLIRRYVTYKPGSTSYDRRKIIEWQQNMQATVFFSSVDVDLATPGARQRSTPQQAADMAAEAAGAGDVQAVQPAASMDEDAEQDVAGEDRQPAEKAEAREAVKAQESQRQRGSRFAALMARDQVTVPVLVEVIESPARRVGVAVGVDSDVGPRLETTYEQNVVMGYPLEMRSGLGLDPDQQRAYLDFYLPPNPKGYRDKFGLLAEHHDIQGQDVRRIAFGGARERIRKGAGNSRVEYETRLGLVTAFDDVRIDGGSSYTLPSVTATYQWLRRDVDNKFNPRQGHLIDLGAGLGTALNGFDPYSRLQARGQYWWPVGERDLVTVRGEVGKVWAGDGVRIPSDFGFRTGGARTIRGYRYLRLGLEEGDAVIGAPALAVASVEYQHFFTDMLGMGVFVDVGDA
nr:BamA/TamA family outer membrane protein [Pseudomonas sp.]